MPGGTTTSPSGFRRSEATFATNLLAATPTDAVRARLEAMRALIVAATVGPSPESRSVPVTSRKASSMDTGSSSGVNSARMAMTCRETAAYLSMSTGTNAPSGHRRAARPIGIAECTPNRRASYEAAETTPRPRGSAPTMTGRPRSSGRSRCSTDA